MIGKDSRYGPCVLYRHPQGDFLGRRQRIDTTPCHDDHFYSVVEGDRIDLIAHRYLGDARLWWVIADYNELFFPLELAIGSVLRIPSVEHVQMRVLD